MKKIKILFTVLMLFAFVYKAEAQIVVTSTTASTEKTPKTKSIRQKGLVVRPEIGIGLNLEKGMQLNILGIANYQFNPYISLGGGTGLSYNNFDEDFGQHFFSIPIYANIRGYFCDRKWSPYYDIKLGFNGTINQKDYYEYQEFDNYYESYNKYKYTEINLTGFYADFGLGMQYKNYDFGIELYLYPVNYDRFYYQDVNFGFSEWIFAESVKEFDLFSVCLKFAYNFQIQKK